MLFPLFCSPFKASHILLLVLFQLHGLFLSLIVINERYTKYKLLSLYNGNHIMFSGLFDDGSNMIILLII